MFAAYDSLGASVECKRMCRCADKQRHRVIYVRNYFAKMLNIPEQQIYRLNLITFPIFIFTSNRYTHTHMHTHTHTLTHPQTSISVVNFNKTTCSRYMWNDGVRHSDKSVVVWILSYLLTQTSQTTWLWVINVKLHERRREEEREREGDSQNWLKKRF